MSEGVSETKTVLYVDGWSDGLSHKRGVDTRTKSCACNMYVASFYRHVYPNMNVIDMCSACQDNKHVAVRVKCMLCACSKKINSNTEMSYAYYCMHVILCNMHGKCPKSMHVT